MANQLKIALAFCCTQIVLSATVIGSNAGDPSGFYNVTHNFNFTPAGDVVSGMWNYSVFTSAAFPSMRCGPLTGSVAMPVTQTKTCMSTATSGASALANSSVTTTNFAPGNVTGTIHVDGNAIVPNLGEAFSSARSGVVVRGGMKMRNGRIKWGPAMGAQVNGQASANVHDPIFFDVFNPDLGIDTTGTLLDIEGVLNGPGSFSWDNNLFSVDATSFTFTVDITSPFVPANERGTVDFEMSNGTVTASAATGIFSGLFPSVGSSGPFSMPLSNDLTLDYDLGNMGGDNAAVAFNFAGGGDAAAAPEPAAFLMIGLGMLLIGLVRLRLRRGSLS